MTFAPADIAARYNLTRRNGRYAGPCPKCGGSKTSDKFSLRDDGGFKCYGSCGFKGDAITWLREMEGLSCPDAHESADKRCELTTCPVYGTCRMGDGSGKIAKKRNLTSVAPVAAASVKPLSTAETRDPETLWQDWAAEFVQKSATALEKNKQALAWLAARGIDASVNTGIEWGLGWSARNGKVDRADIGLPVEADGKPHLWIPAGLVITTFDAAGHVHRLRIRRTDADRAKFLPDLKYVWLQGSGTAPMIIVPDGESRGAVIVEAELDAIACASAHPGVTVIALGTVSAGLPASVRAQLDAAPVILVALDADPGKDGKAGAGPAAIKAWLGEYRKAKYWPVPAGKDPGDYVKDHGGNLHPWIEAGLTPPLRAADPATPGQAETPCNLKVSGGGAGAEGQPIPQAVAVADRGAAGESGGQSGENDAVPAPLHGVSAGGREYIVVYTRGQQRQMSERFPGVPILGSREVAKLDPRSAEAVLMLKTEFPGCEVVETRQIVGDGSAIIHTNHNPARQRRATQRVQL